jgi:hypothetical protein
MGVHLGRGKPHLVRVVVSGGHYATQDVAHFGLVVDKPQQRLAVSALLTDAQNIFSSGVYSDNKEVLVQQDDARAQGVNDIDRVAAERSAIVGAAARTDGRCLA